MNIVFSATHWGPDGESCTIVRERAEDVVFPCKVGRIPLPYHTEETFFIESVRDGMVTLSLRYGDDAPPFKRWMLGIGDGDRYCPETYDGGTDYEFCITE